MAVTAIKAGTQLSLDAKSSACSTPLITHFAFCVHVKAVQLTPTVVNGFTGKSIQPNAHQCNNAEFCNAMTLLFNYLGGLLELSNCQPALARARNSARQ